jgi:hypothetical protein
LYERDGIVATAFAAACANWFARTDNEVIEGEFGVRWLPGLWKTISPKALH